jgi:2-(1,2-epoxy-1,2-dihydrophenyl)acetyl-CoA isomerase
VRPFTYIQLHTAHNVATLTLHRPNALNALNLPMLEEIDRALREIRDTPTVRALLVTGAGRAFSSGADLAEAASTPGDVGSVLESHYNPVIEKMAALEVPIVTAVNGAAVGAGCSIALAGDIVVAAHSAYFLQAFINIGLVPDGGATWMLPRLAGKARALAMMMLGERVSAEQAESWGMIFRAVPDEQLLPLALRYAERLAQGPTKAYTLIRQGIRKSLESTLSETLKLERINQKVAGQTADFAEGVAAFRAKRPARFTGG